MKGYNIKPARCKGLAGFWFGGYDVKEKNELLALLALWPQEKLLWFWFVGENTNKGEKKPKGSIGQNPYDTLCINLIHY